MRQYLEEATASHGQAPAFTVSLPQDETGSAGAIHRFSFKPGQMGMDPTADEGMVGWKAVAGSKVGELLGLQTFALPDGTRLRLYRKGECRNALPPRDEPPDPAPGGGGGDGSDGGDGMPSLTPMPAPSRRDMPRLPLSVHLQFPQPVRHTLPQGADGSVAADGVWFGTITAEPMLLGARELTPAEAEEAAVAALEAAHTPLPFIDGPIDQSVFAPRRTTSDSRSYFNGPKVLKRGLDIDFARCNGERFRVMIARESGSDDGEEQGEIDALYEVLQRHTHAVYAVYGYYCVNGQSHDRFVMGLNEYASFCRECAIADETSRHCHQTHVDAVFVAADAEEQVDERKIRASGGGGKQAAAAQRKQNEQNVDRALMRFEWLQALVRIAVIKYAKEESTEQGGAEASGPTLAPALERLLTEAVLPKVPVEALHDSDVFRRQRLYTHEVAAVFARYDTSLKAVYETFSAAKFDARQTDTRARASLMELDEWTLLLQSAGLLDGLFTKRHASLCFVWAQPFTTDDLKRRTALVHLQYVDFLEALARIATFKRLPTKGQLAQHGCTSCASFFAQPKLVEAELLAAGPMSWQQEETSPVPLEEPLEMLLSLLVERLDSDGNGVLRAKELKRFVPS